MNDAKLDKLKEIPLLNPPKKEMQFFEFMREHPFLASGAFLSDALTGTRILEDAENPYQKVGGYSKEDLEEVDLPIQPEGSLIDSYVISRLNLAKAGLAKAGLSKAGLSKAGELLDKSAGNSAGALENPKIIPVSVAEPFDPSPIVDELGFDPTKFRDPVSFGRRIIGAVSPYSNPKYQYRGEAGARGAYILNILLNKLAREYGEVTDEQIMEYLSKRYGNPNRHISLNPYEWGEGTRYPRTPGFWDPKKPNEINVGHSGGWKKWFMKRGFSEKEAERLAKLNRTSVMEHEYNHSIRNIVEGSNDVEGSIGEIVGAITQSLSNKGISSVLKITPEKFDEIVSYLRRVNPGAKLDTPEDVYRMIRRAFGTISMGPKNLGQGFTASDPYLVNKIAGMGHFGKNIVNPWARTGGFGQHQYELLVDALRSGKVRPSEIEGWLKEFPELASVRRFAASSPPPYPTEDPESYFNFLKKLVTGSLFQSAAGSGVSHTFDAVDDSSDHQHEFVDRHFELLMQEKQKRNQQMKDSIEKAKAISDEDANILRLREDRKESPYSRRKH